MRSRYADIIGQYDPNAELEAATLYTETPGTTTGDRCASTLRLPAIAELAVEARRNLWNPNLLPLIDRALYAARVSEVGDYYGCGSYRLMLQKVRNAITTLRGIGSSGVGPLFGPSHVSPQPRPPMAFPVPSVFVPQVPARPHPLPRPRPRPVTPGTSIVTESQRLLVLWFDARARRQSAAVQNALKNQFLHQAAREGRQVGWYLVGLPPTPPRTSTEPPGSAFVPSQGPSAPILPFTPPLH